MEGKTVAIFSVLVLGSEVIRAGGCSVAKSKSPLERLQTGSSVYRRVLLLLVQEGQS